MGRIVPSRELTGKLADIVLPSSDDVPTRFGDLWAAAPVLVIHLRHFGCILCRHFAARLRDRHSEFTDLGVDVVAVGTGGRQYARSFIEDRDIRYPILVDKHLETHAVIETKRGPPWGILAPNVLASAAKALKYGERQGKNGPHPWSLGAAHLFGRGGVPTYGWINENYNDNPQIDDLLAAAGESA